MRRPTRDSAFIAALSTVAASCIVSSTAWSQASVESSDEEILAILAPELSDARLLTMQELTEEQNDNLDAPGAGRRLEGDFNSDGRPELTLFGADSSRTFAPFPPMGVRE